MHTVPLAERFGVPACLAAAFHVALFLINPIPDVPVIRLPDPGELIPRVRHVPIDLVAQEDPEPSTAPVQALPNSGGPARPMTEDRSVPDLTAIVMAPGAPIVPGVVTDLNAIPKGFGDGKPGVPTGVDASHFTGFTVDQLDRVPQARVQPAPDYPPALRQAGIEGSVLVAFDVDVNGRVVSARVVESSHREFDASAIRAVLKWRFDPGRFRGKPVAFRMVVPISFSLEE